MWIRIRDAAKKTGIPEGSIFRYARQKEFEVKYNENNEKLVRVKDVESCRKRKKPTGRPKKPVRVFEFDWDTFYEKIKEKYGDLKGWIKKSRFKRCRFYRIKSGDLYPTKKEMEKLKKEL